MTAVLRYGQNNTAPVRTVLQGLAGQEVELQFDIVCFCLPFTLPSILPHSHASLSSSPSSGNSLRPVCFGIGIPHCCAFLFALVTEFLSLWDLCEGNLEGAPLLGTLKGV
jgi:hypothetical protein